jgi:hypothetical protein
MMFATTALAFCGASGCSKSAQQAPDSEPKRPLVAESASAGAPSLRGVPSGAAAQGRPTVAGGAASNSARVADASPGASLVARENGSVVLVPSSAQVVGKNFTINTETMGCRVDVPCEVTLKLQVTGGYHVNKEFPYKFVGTPAPTHQFIGKDDSNIFSRASGDFREEGEKTAVMSVRVKPSAAGDHSLMGTYKLSVCSDESCQIEMQAISLVLHAK